MSDPFPPFPCLFPLDATEHGDELVFLHRVKDGPANGSYGLQIARLAGVPLPVLERARAHLERLEAAPPPAADTAAAPQLPLFAAAEPVAIAALKAHTPSPDNAPPCTRLRP